MSGTIAHPGTAQGARQADPPPALTGDHLIIVRQAVADTQRACGTPHLAELTLRGDADQLPMMQAAATAVQRILKGLFE
jgi:hypothetical protein